MERLIPVFLFLHYVYSIIKSMRQYCWQSLRSPPRPKEFRRRRCSPPRILQRWLGRPENGLIRLKRKEKKIYRIYTLTYKRNAEGKCAIVEVPLEYRGDKDLQREIHEIAMKFTEELKRPCEHCSYRNVPTLPSSMQVGKPLKTYPGDYYA